MEFSRKYFHVNFYKIYFGISLDAELVDVLLVLILKLWRSLIEIQNKLRIISCIVCSTFLQKGCMCAHTHTVNRSPNASSSLHRHIMYTHDTQGFSTVVITSN